MTGRALPSGHSPLTDSHRLVPAPVSAAPARPDPAPATGAARPATADMTGGQSRAGEVSFKNNDALFMVQYNRKCTFELKLQLIWPNI